METQRLIRMPPSGSLQTLFYHMSLHQAMCCPRALFTIGGIMVGVIMFHILGMRLIVDAIVRIVTIMTQVSLTHLPM